MCGDWVSWKKMIASWDTRRSKETQRVKECVVENRGCPFNTGQPLYGLKMRAERGLQVTATLDVTFPSPGSESWVSDAHSECALVMDPCAPLVLAHVLWGSRIWAKPMEKIKREKIKRKRRVARESRDLLCTPGLPLKESEMREKLFTDCKETLAWLSGSPSASNTHERIPLSPPLAGSGQRPAQCWFQSW